MTATTAPPRFVAFATSLLVFLTADALPSSGGGVSLPCFIRSPAGAERRCGRAHVALRRPVSHVGSFGCPALGVAAAGIEPEALISAAAQAAIGAVAAVSLASAVGSSASSSSSSSLLDGIRPLDDAAAVAIGFGALPLAEAFFNATTGTNRPGIVFRETAANQFGEAASTAGRVALAVLLAGPIASAAQHLGLLSGADEAPDMVAHVSSVAPRVGFIVWFAASVRSFKRYFLANIVQAHPDDFEQLGKMSLYDRIFDVLIAVVAAGFVVSATGVTVGPGIMSVFTLGGVGTVVLGIASRDVADQLVGGLLVSAWDAFEEGDEIKLGDGTEGIVARIGLFETDLRGFDNIVTRIPNSQIVRQRVSNLSRVLRCQVKQVIRYPYSDRDKLPAVLLDIKACIADSCPDLIADGTRPFRADPFSYRDDHIELVVNCHFQGIPPSGNEYLDNRRRVLEAIGKAMDDNGVDFALPSLVSFPGRAQDGGKSDRDGQ